MTTYIKRRIATFLALGALVSSGTLGCVVGADDDELSGDRADVPMNTLQDGAWVLARLGADDLASTQLATDQDLARAVNHERAPVSMNWRHDGSRMPAMTLGAQRSAAPYLASSREFVLRVSALDLAQGVELPISSPGAVVKLSGSGAVGVTAFEPEDLTLTASDGTVYTDGQGMDLIVDAEKMQAAGPDFLPGTTLFRVSADLGAGPVTVAWDGLALEDPTLEASIIVREPASDVALELSTAAPVYLQGQEIEFSARWAANASVQPADEPMYGTLYGPNDTRFAVELNRAADADGRFTGSVVLPEVTFEPGHLWTLEVEARGQAGGHEVARTARTAFAYTPATAQLTGEVKNHMTARTDDVRMALLVDVGSPGRYAATGVLYGTDQAGEMHAIAVAQSAAFLEPGQQHIDMSFDRALIDEAGLGAPFQVRDLTLFDQTRLGLLHRQSIALAFQ